MDDKNEMKGDGAAPNGSLHANAASSPEAYARYVGDLVRRLADMEEDVRRVGKLQWHCLGGQHVAGDGKFDARIRALPVNRAHSQALRQIKALRRALNRAVLKRNQHADRVRKLPWIRYEKAVQKGKVAIPPATSNPPQQAAIPREPGYSGIGQEQFWADRERYGDGRESA